MNRRDFLKQSTFFSIGGLLIPPALLASCRNNTLFEHSPFHGKVIIIGAGVAGLYAGYLLKSKGINFQILEASGNYGGRLGKLSGFANFPLDTGAEWLHGKNSIVGDLIKQSGIKVTIDNSDERYWFNNQMLSSLPRDINAIFTRESNLPDVSFADFSQQEGFGNEYKYMVEAIAGDSGAAASRISTYWKIKEEENWSSGDHDYKFEETYFDLIDRTIASEVKDNIQLHTIVKKINYTASNIEITDSNNNTYLADKVIITVPISMLKSNLIEFIPQLPEAKITAFSKIGMDAGMKVFLKFTHHFYDQNIIGGSISASYADESIGKRQNDHVLMAFIMGEQAEYLTALGSDHAMTTALLQELDAMYNGQASAAFIASHVENWTTKPFIQGAYSYSTIDMGNAREISAQPIADKLYFAGEAMNTNGHHQTVQGAIETGYREVIHILNGVSQK